MEQRIENLAPADLSNLDNARRWVCDHFVPEAQHKYSEVSEKLRLLQTILDAGWIQPTETAKLQSLGITLGDALAQELRMEWVMVEDDYGRDPALRLPGTTVILFPLTMISKRIEDGETVDVADFFANVCRRTKEIARDADKPRPSPN
jgi:hypothetical protein